MLIIWLIIIQLFYSSVVMLVLMMAVVGVVSAAETQGQGQEDAATLRAVKVANSAGCVSISTTLLSGALVMTLLSWILNFNPATSAQ